MTLFSAFPQAAVKTVDLDYVVPSQLDPSSSSIKSEPAKHPMSSGLYCHLSNYRSFVTVRSEGSPPPLKKPKVEPTRVISPPPLKKPKVEAPEGRVTRQQAKEAGKLDTVKRPKPVNKLDEMESISKFTARVIE